MRGNINIRVEGESGLVDEYLAAIAEKAKREDDVGEVCKWVVDNKEYGIKEYGDKKCLEIHLYGYYHHLTPDEIASVFTIFGPDDEPDGRTLLSDEKLDRLAMIGHISYDNFVLLDCYFDQHTYFEIMGGCGYHDAEDDGTFCYNDFIFSAKYGFERTLYEHVVGYNGGNTRVEIPEGVKSIHKKAFIDCKPKVKMVILPDGLEKIRYDAFPDDCFIYFKNKSFREMDIKYRNHNVRIFAKDYYRKKPVLNENEREECLEYIKEKKSYYWKMIEEYPGLKKLMRDAFGIDAKKVEDEKREKEEKQKERDLSRSAKDPFNATDMKKIWSYRKWKDGTLVLTSYKGKDTDVVIPERIGNSMVAVLDTEVFSPYKSGRKKEQKKVLENIKSVIIPDNVKKIGIDAFCGCCNLQSIVIPDRVTNIGRGAFWGCEKLADDDGFVIIKNILFGYFGTEENVRIPDGVTEISNEAFCDCESLQSIVISNSVTKIGDGAFYGCESLQSIVIPDSVTKIGDWTFYGCESLQSIVIPNSVTKIGDWTFYNCSSLQSIVIPDSVTEIGSTAFDGCEVIIQCKSGSYAEEYAKKYYINYKIVD